MTNLDTTSLLDRSGLDRDAVRSEIARGLAGADDGELFLEYRQSEALMFDNGRLKQATYDTAQGFGLRAVKNDAVGYAHSSDVSIPALIRAADAVGAVRAGYSGSFVGSSRPHQRPPLWRRQPARCAGLRSQGEAAGRNRRLCARQGPARAAGVGQPRSELAGGRDRPPRRRDLSRHPSAGARQRLRRRRLRRPPGNRQPRLWRSRRLCSASSRPRPGARPPTARCGRRSSISNSVPAPAGEMDVVLGPGWPGVMLHEAVGHGLEGDFNRKQTSAFAGLMGQQVARQGRHRGRRRHHPEPPRLALDRRRGHADQPHRADRGRHPHRATCRTGRTRG